MLPKGRHNMQYDLHMRLVKAERISSFELAEGEDLETKVRQEIALAGSEGKLDKLEARVILPVAAVRQVEEGENLSGGENVVANFMFSADGSEVTNRKYRIQGNGGHSMVITVDNEEREDVLGVFPNDTIAQKVGVLWKNGHLD